MNVKHLIAPLALSLMLAGCAASPDGGGTGGGGTGGGSDGSTAAADRTPCPDVVLNQPTDDLHPYRLADADTAFPAGFEFVSDLNPSCVFTYSADGVTHYNANFFGVTEDEVSGAYSDAAAAASANGWSAITEDADALGDGFIDGDWVADPSDVDTPEVHVQAFLPLGPEFAPAYGVDPETNFFGIDVVVKN